MAQMPEVTYTSKAPVRSKVPTLDDVLRIAKREELPTKPAPEVKPWEVPMMAKGLLRPPANVALPVLRLSHADIEELVGWAKGKFTERFPDAREEVLRHFAQMAAGGNQYGAFRTVQTWGVVSLARHPMESKPIGEVLFLLSKGLVPSRELKALLEKMLQWAKHAQCGSFRMLPYHDLEESQLKNVLEDLGFSPGAEAPWKRF